jgi:hypothetical protein
VRVLRKTLQAPLTRSASTGGLAMIGQRLLKRITLL